MKRWVPATRFWAWLIAFAIFAAALAPTIHHAKGSSGENGLAFTALCTTGGLKWLNLNTGQIEDSAPTSGEHNPGSACDCCTSTSHSPALLTAENVTTFAAEQRSVPDLSLLLQTPIRRVAWRQSYPRAPPYTT